MKLNDKAELRKMALNYRKENLVYKAKLIKIIDILDDDSNPFVQLRKIREVIQK